MKKWTRFALSILSFLLVVVIGILVIRAQQSPIVKTKTIRLIVLAQEGTFRIACADELQVKAGEDIGFSIDVIPEQGFNKSVAFVLEGGPTGMTVNWPVGNVWTTGRPEPDNIQCNLTIPLDNSLVGDWTVTLTGASVEQ